MLDNKIKKTFHVQTIVYATDFRPLTAMRPPYQENYPFWQLMYVGRGQMSVRRDGREETVGTDSILFRPPAMTSTMVYPTNCELYLGLIDFICTDPAMNTFGTHPIPLDRHEAAVLSELIREAARFYNTASADLLWTELISSGLESFLVRLYGRLKGVFPPAAENDKSNRKNSVSETVNRINDLLANRLFSAISIDEISSILNESPNVLMKLYKKEMNEGIMEHFLLLKLQAAMTLILSSTMNFTEISDLLGFSSVNYFSKFFKKHTGITPTEYSRRGHL